MNKKHINKLIPIALALLWVGPAQAKPKQATIPKATKGATTIKLSIDHNGRKHEPVILLDKANSASFRIRGEEMLDINVQLVDASSSGPKIYLQLDSELGADRLMFSSLALDKSAFELKSKKQSITLKVVAK